MSITPQSPGLLISFEGIDGSGKSILAQCLKSVLAEHTIPVLLTKEPGGTPLGLTLRTILQEQETPLSAKTEFLLFAADRAQHHDQIIRPFIQQGYIVFSDRMADSSLAYQAYGRGLDIALVDTINRWAMHNQQPTISFYLKIDYQTALQRCQHRAERLTAFELRGKEYMERVIQGYDALAAQYPERIKVINASGSIDEVFTQALQILRAIIEEKYNVSL